MDDDVQQLELTGDAVGEGTNDKDDDAFLVVELPVLEFGYRIEPMEWPELREIIGKQELSKLTRNVAQQRRYEIFKRNLKLHWNSLCDYM